MNIPSSWKVATLAFSMAAVMAVGGCSQAPPDRPLRYGYIANAGDGTLSVVDLRTHEVVRTATISPGEGGATSHGVALSADHTRLFVGDAARGLLRVLDTTSLAVVADIDLGIKVHGIDITPDARRLVVSGSRLPDKDFKYSYVVDTESLEIVSRIETNISGHGDCTPDGRYMYINDIIGHRVAVIDLVKGALVNEMPVGPEVWPPKTVGPNEVTFAPDGNTAYTADYGAQTISILDTSDPEQPVVTGEIPVEDLPHGIDLTADGERLWVANRRSQDVAVIATATGKELDRISTAPYTANHVALTPDGRFAYVTLTATDEMTDSRGYLLVLGVEDHKEVARVALGIGPHEISFED